MLISENLSYLISTKSVEGLRNEWKSPFLTFDELGFSDEQHGRKSDLLTTYGEGLPYRVLMISV
jgi:hypothetical protein